MPTPPKYRLKYYPFGGSLNTRNNSFGSDFRFMKLIQRLSFFVLLFLNFACNGQPKMNNIKDCKTIYDQANNKLNEYYLTNNDSCLNQLIVYAKENSSICPEYKIKLTELTLTALTLLYEYEKAYALVNSLNINDFSKAYKKNMYLKTFKALTFEIQGDTLRSDSCFKEVVTEIESYILEYPSDKDAIADLFFTKVRYNNIEIVIKEIELLREKNSIDVDFFEGLKQTIMSMPE